MHKSLIIFDLDGTLIDSIPDLAIAVNQALAHHHALQADIQQIKSWVGNGSYLLMSRACKWAGISDERIDDVHDAFLDAYAKCCSNLTLPYAGVNDGLMRLKQAGYLLAIATNKPSAFLPDIITSVGWQERFSIIIGGDDTPAKKPDPMPLLHICQKLGVDAQQAIMVGDSKNDILAGQNAGMMTLALSYGYNYGEPIAQSNPDKVFDEFGELVEWLLAHKAKNL